MRLHFGHAPEVLEFWRSLAGPILRRGTPFFLFSIQPVERALRELQGAFGHVPVRYWLSCKTQPLPQLLRWWCRQGHGLEVVSEFELLAALREGFPPQKILVNGPAKHQWLSRHPKPNLLVNFDSPAEIRALLPLAKRLHWRIGLRINTRQEHDPEDPLCPTQFGFVAADAVAWMRELARRGLRLEILHFHLRSNVKSAAVYDDALQELAAICRAAEVWPRVVDCGGGFPPPNVLDGSGSALNDSFCLAEMARVYGRALKSFQGLSEIWLENGRWLTARSGVLVLKILDVKEHGRMRHLICDGGRTLHALVSTWEMHELVSIEPRRGPTRLTTVNGPTCMAFDKLARRELPRTLRAGDHLLWLDAGAYHLPWETRFSHGHAPVFWHDGKTTRLVRGKQNFDEWWSQWRLARPSTGGGTRPR